jgi:hypothetical protein
MWDVKAIGCLASYLNLTNDFRRFPVSTLKSALKVDHDHTMLPSVVPSWSALFM